MRNTLLISMSLTIFCSPSLAMEQLFHFFDKNFIDPINYVTEAKSSELCEQVASFNPSNPFSKSFALDHETLDKVHQLLEREQKILYIAEEAICEIDSHGPLERILLGAHPAYFSPNCLAIMHGYLTTKIKRNEETVVKLKKAQNSAPLNSQPLQPEAASITSAVAAKAARNSESIVHVATLDLSPSALEQSILDSNPGLLMKLANLVRKTTINPTGYLTDNKAAMISEAVLLFHPDHPQRVCFNQSLPLHQALVHQAFERQIRFHTQIETALRKNDHQTILTLQKVQKGYFSKNADILFAAYLKFATERSSIDNAVRQANEKNSRKDSVKKSPLNAETDCSCSPPKKLQNCAECLSKLVQQQPQKEKPD